MPNEKSTPGLEPAFGYPAHTDINDAPGHGRKTNSHPQQPGMSKRFYAACCATRGILAGAENSIGHHPELLVEWAYKIADELIKQEFEKNK